MVKFIEDRLLTSSKMIEQEINKSIDRFNHDLDETLKQINSKSIVQ